MSKLRGRAAALGLLLGIAGCGHPSGPIFGDWRGDQPTRVTGFTQTVELVLEGPPGAQSGSYRIATTVHDPQPCGEHGTRRWSDIWTSEPRVANGHLQTNIHLHNTLPGEINTYELTPDGSLRAVDRNGQGDKLQAGKLNVLSPVSQGPGYGQN
jgi:hypothetical protein